MSKELMKAAGIQALGVDIGAVGDLDPQILILAWRLRSKTFFEFYDKEWAVLFANEMAFTFDDMKKAIAKWTKEIQTDQTCFKSFYIFVFNYLKGEERATVLSKRDAVYGWQLLGMDKKFHFWKQWEKFWDENDLKGVNLDTWCMLPRFVDHIGNDVSKFSEDDAWPLIFEEFVANYLKK